MNQSTFEPKLIYQWSVARCIARQLPAPVPDFGGHRIDTFDGIERHRWVFPCMQPGIQELGLIIDHPKDCIKLCGTAAQLAAVLSTDWEIAESGHVMTSLGVERQSDLPSGYKVEIRQLAPVTEVRIFSARDQLAASGYAAETDDLFIYDRIVTEPEHRRKGLGRVLMGTLHASIKQAGVKQLLVATDQGRRLYESLGWTVISPYTTARKLC